jgi:hypothetical protein
MKWVRIAGHEQQDNSSRLIVISANDTTNGWLSVLYGWLLSGSFFITEARVCGRSMLYTSRYHMRNLYMG